MKIPAWVINIAIRFLWRLVFKEQYEEFMSNDAPPITTFGKKTVEDPDD